MIDLTGIIDMGTNTFKLLVIRKNDDGTPLFVHKRVLPVKLGEEGIGQNRIAPEAFDRGVKAAGKLAATARGYECDTVIGFATSSVRSAENGEEFIEQVKSQHGIDVTVITGEREAELIFKGVRNAVNLGSDRKLIMDIGGGSIEFVIADASRLYWRHSFDLGVARLRELYDLEDTLREIDRENLTFYLERRLSPLFEALRQFPSTGLIGCSGSFESLCEIIEAEDENENGEHKNNRETTHVFDHRLDEWIERLIASSHNKRKNIEGLAAMRVDTIHIAAFIIKFVRERADLRETVFSHYSMKEGIWFEMKGE